MKREALGGELLVALFGAPIDGPDAVKARAGGVLLAQAIGALLRPAG